MNIADIKYLRAAFSSQKMKELACLIKKHYDGPITVERLSCMYYWFVIACSNEQKTDLEISNLHFYYDQSDRIIKATDSSFEFYIFNMSSQGRIRGDWLLDTNCILYQEAIRMGELH